MPLEEEDEGITDQGEQRKRGIWQPMSASGSSRLSIANRVALGPAMDGRKPGNTGQVNVDNLGQTGKKQAGANHIL